MTGECRNLGLQETRLQELQARELHQETGPELQQGQPNATQPRGQSDPIRRGLEDLRTGALRGQWQEPEDLGSPEQTDKHSGIRLCFAVS